MAQIEIRLSQKVNKITGRSEILLRLYQGKKYDLYAKTGIFILPRYFEYYINFKKTEANGIEVPSRCITMNREEAAKRHIVLFDRGEIVVNARMLTDDVKYHKDQLQIISDLKHFILTEHESAQSDQISADWLNTTIDRFLHPEKYIVIEEEQNAVPSFFELMELYLLKKDFSLDHTKAFRVLIRDLARFEAFIRLTDYKRKDFKLDIDLLSRNDIESFREYLKNEVYYAEKYPNIFEELLSKYPLSISTVRKTPKLEVRGNNTVVKLMKKFKTFFKWLNDNSYTTNHPFDGFTIGSEIYGAPVFISIEERNRIADFNLSARPELEVQRDIFVFQCLIGCRVGDFMKLTQDNLYYAVGVNRWMLTYIPHKTIKGKKQVNPRIPLNNRALKLIDKYKGKDPDGRLFPFISLDKYNKAIKKIFELCGITRNVVVLDPKTNESVIKPIGEVAASHIARRTFSGAAYKKVKDPNVVGKMTGHVEGSRAFMRYRDIDDDMLKEVIDMIE